MLNTLPAIEGLQYYPEFFDAQESLSLFTRLTAQLAWQEEFIKMFGNPIKVPRLVCWYGDENVQYRYSGVDHKGLPWTTDLLHIKSRIEKHTQAHFNSVLGNYYRNETDSMGWHSDNERELGGTPCIASLSLGEERLFKIRNNKQGTTYNIPLSNGSLLVMSGNFQNEWKHSIPKTKAIKQARINLTYRFIYNRQ